MAMTVSKSRTNTGTTVEHLGTRSTYTYQFRPSPTTSQHGTPLPFDVDDAVTNMQYIDAAYTAAGHVPTLTVTAPRKHLSRIGRSCPLVGRRLGAIAMVKA